MHDAAGSRDDSRKATAAESWTSQLLARKMKHLPDGWSNKGGFKPSPGALLCVARVGQRQVGGRQPRSIGGQQLFTEASCRPKIGALLRCLLDKNPAVKAALRQATQVTSRGNADRSPCKTNCRKDVQKHSQSHTVHKGQLQCNLENAPDRKEPKPTPLAPERRAERPKRQSRPVLLQEGGRLSLSCLESITSYTGSHGDTRITTALKP